MTNEPFLSRFTTELPSQSQPPLRQNPDTQMTEVHHRGGWISALDHAELLGHGQTKTAVQQESTDYA